MGRRRGVVAALTAVDVVGVANAIVRATLRIRLAAVDALVALVVVDRPVRLRNPRACRSLPFKVA